MLVFLRRNDVLKLVFCKFCTFLRTFLPSSTVPSSSPP